MGRETSRIHAGGSDDNAGIHDNDSARILAAKYLERNNGKVRKPKNTNAAAGGSLMYACLREPAFFVLPFVFLICSLLA